MADRYERTEGDRVRTIRPMEPEANVNGRACDVEGDDRVDAWSPKSDIAVILGEGMGRRVRRDFRGGRGRIGTITGRNAQVMARMAPPGAFVSRLPAAVLLRNPIAVR